MKKQLSICGVITYVSQEYHSQVFHIVMECLNVTACFFIMSPVKPTVGNSLHVTGPLISEEIDPKTFQSRVILNYPRVEELLPC